MKVEVVCVSWLEFTIIVRKRNLKVDKLVSQTLFYKKF